MAVFGHWQKKWNILWLMIVNALHGGSGVLYALLLRNIVDSAVDGDRNGFKLNVLLIILLVLAQVAMRAIIRWLEELSRASFENLFKQRLLNNILTKDFGTVSSVHSGEWLNRLTNDTVVVAQNSVEILPGLAGMIVKMVSAMVMMIFLDYRFALVLLPVGIVLFFATYGFRKVLKKLHKNIQERDGKLRVYLQERLGSMMMIRSFAAEKQTEAEALDKMCDHKGSRMKRVRFSNFCNIGFQTGMQGMYVGGVIYCGYGILTGAISYGTLTAITQLISQIQSPFANITGYLPKYYAMTASAERLMEIEEFENDNDVQPMDIDETLDYYRSSFKAMGLDNAEFAYYPSGDSVRQLSKDTMPVVLRDISVEIGKGQYVAFTGHSGCGKSTVLKLLMCIYKLDDGRRYITDRSGNTEELSAKFHRLFAYVPQGNQLMSGTIREVICFADKSGLHDDERINEALKIACAYEFVSELDDGVDTLLGERGTGLSEGQMQRIAIARAIYSKCPILLLDEATSALDETTERKVLENLKKMTDKSVVIVTHRPAALDICDRILQFTDNGVIENGKA
ncbi:ABC-type multidrug transport system, ATPase and permease component [Ruminococcus flavefaciens]|uniref:ABC-type multidrug transport system, ATPase and permease component n=1 Tax=Ruminococcus flavefaciens TaxID=1265 RepID=A0A1H6LSY5_RUMFL|nr:ABC transporter ATP-binding protein [Ruminococcus flavefaciens]SEH88106.1 ABC-type multidrug transport system, ATPase and permease component [Ruminococcus flavefaciens]